jgi:glutamate--cysteine ligase
MTDGEVIRMDDLDTMAAGTLRDVSGAVAHLAGVCFKTGPPSADLIGAELEWTVHHDRDPARPLSRALLSHALHPHAPATLDPNTPALPLPSGARLTVEPGGQVEISTLPQPSLAALRYAIDVDVDHLAGLLHRSGLHLGRYGLDAERAPARILRTPRYEAMSAALARHGPHGHTMMCSTAGLQVCLDAGRPDEARARWDAVHDVGPALVALFANSGRYAGHDTGWASARMGTWLGMDPGRTAPVPAGGGAVADWTDYALRAPVLCVRDPDGPWRTPADVSFRAWIDGAIRPGPTLDDLDYHLTTLFPPVRPRGYLEVRYLDTQPGGEWIAPVAVLAALVTGGGPDTARDLAAATAGRWRDAARLGLTDAALRSAARRLADLAFDRLDRTGLSGPDQRVVRDIVDRRLSGPGADAARPAPVEGCG